MTDKISTSERSWNMSVIRSTGMKPEMLVRSLAHRMGYRHRLHAKDLPGKPDLVFRPRKKVIFVHGCNACSSDTRQTVKLPQLPRLMAGDGRDGKEEGQDTRTRGRFGP